MKSQDSTWDLLFGSVYIFYYDNTLFILSCKAYRRKNVLFADKDTYRESHPVLDATTIAQAVQYQRFGKLHKKCTFGKKCVLTTLIELQQQRNARKEVKMLVLSRKKDETIILKGPDMSDIKITIVRIDNRNKVRIGIEADKEITVLRSELNEKCLGEINKKVQISL